MLKNCTMALVAAAAALLPLQVRAADNPIDRTIQRAAETVEQVVALPIVGYDAIESGTPIRLSRRLPFAHRIVRGIVAIPRDVVRGAEYGVWAMVTKSAIAHGVPVALAHGVVRIESGYRCSAYNRSGASGLMQVLPRTAAGVGVHGSLRSCAAGLEAGMRYLAEAWHRSGGNFCSAASLYNSGTAGSGHCSSYGRKVMALARA